METFKKELKVVGGLGSLIALEFAESPDKDEKGGT